MNFKETLAKCKEFNFNEEITQEMLWNTAYGLGRDRWHWGPRWMVSVRSWINTQLAAMRKDLFRL